MMNLCSHLSEQWKFIACTRKWNSPAGELQWTQKGKFPPWSIRMHFLSPQWKLYTFIQCQNSDQRVSPVLIRMANFQLNKLTDHRDALMRKKKKKKWSPILILLSLISRCTCWYSNYLSNHLTKSIRFCKVTPSTFPDPPTQHLLPFLPLHLWRFPLRRVHFPPRSDEASKTWIMQHAWLKKSLAGSEDKEEFHHSLLVPFPIWP